MQPPVMYSNGFINPANHYLLDQSDAMLRQGAAANLHYGQQAYNRLAQANPLAAQTAAAFMGTPMQWGQNTQQHFQQMANLRANMAYDSNQFAQMRPY